MFLVLMYMPQAYALLLVDAEGIGTATTDFGCCQMSVSRFLQGECQSVWDQRVHERRGLKPVAEGGREQGYCSAGSDSETRKAKLDAEFHTGDYSKKCLSYLSYRRPHGDGFLCG